MATSSITSAQAGTAVVTGAGSLKGLALTMPIVAGADGGTPLTLLDGAGGKVLYSALIGDLAAFLFATKPASVPPTPGGPTAPPAGTVLAAAAIPFTAGLFVKSCPANATFTATT